MHLWKHSFWNSPFEQSNFVKAAQRFAAKVSDTTMLPKDRLLVQQYL